MPVKSILMRRGYALALDDDDDDDELTGSPYSRNDRDTESASVVIHRIRSFSSENVYDCQVMPSFHEYLRGRAQARPRAAGAASVDGAQVRTTNAASSALT